MQARGRRKAGGPAEQDRLKKSFLATAGYELAFPELSARLSFFVKPTYSAKSRRREVDQTWPLSLSEWWLTVEFCDDRRSKIHSQPELHPCLESQTTSLRRRDVLQDYHPLGQALLPNYPSTSNLTPVSSSAFAIFQTSQQSSV